VALLLLPQIVSNYLSTAGLVIVMGAHPLVWLAWLAARLLQTYETHSGYATAHRPVPCGPRMLRSPLALSFVL
jgi:hypothetical protein